MEFPEDVLRIIREYSRPITRPDWKRLQKMTHYEFGSQLFITTRIHHTQPIFMRTFEKVWRVSYNNLPIQPDHQPQFCTFHGNDCTTKSKTKRRCSTTCNIPVCRSCNKCPQHK
jgi:hypothetical protein